MCIFTTGGGFQETTPCGLQTWCRTRAYSAHFVQTWCTLFLKKCASGALCTLGQTRRVQVYKNLACTLCTLFLWSAKSAQCFKLSQANLAKHLGIQHLFTHRAYRSRPGRAPAGSPPPLLSERQRADLMHTCCTHNVCHMHTNYIDCTQNAYCVHTK